MKPAAETGGWDEDAVERLVSTRPSTGPTVVSKLLSMMPDIPASSQLHNLVSFTPSGVLIFYILRTSRSGIVCFRFYNNLSCPQASLYISMASFKRWV